MALQPEFYTKLLQISSQTGLKPEDILNVMASESGLNPAAHNPNGNASGLAQFMPATLKGLGFEGDPSQFRQLDEVNQLDYVQKLISNMTTLNGAPLHSAAQYYVGNFIPAALKIPGVKQGNPDTIICAKQPTIAHIPGVSSEKEAQYYGANTSLDADHDGNITYGDIQQILQRVARGKNYQNALADLHQYTGYQPQASAPTAHQDVLQKFLDTLHSSPEANQPSTVNSDTISPILESFLNKLQADVKPITSTIQITGDYTAAIEFGRILSQILHQELSANSSLYCRAHQIELQTTIAHPQLNQTSLTMLAKYAAHLFNQCNKNITVSCTSIINKKSSYQPLSLFQAKQQYRLFHLMKV